MLSFQLIELAVAATIMPIETEEQVIYAIKWHGDDEGRVYVQFHKYLSFYSESDRRGVSQ